MKDGKAEELARRRDGKSVRRRDGKAARRQGGRAAGRRDARTARHDRTGRTRLTSGRDGRVSGQGGKGCRAEKRKG